jgi:FtsH-binding integral membrane protein
MWKHYLTWAAIVAILQNIVGDWIFLSNHNWGIYISFGGVLVIAAGGIIDIEKVSRRISSELERLKPHPVHKQPRQPNGHFARKNPRPE